MTHTPRFGISTFGDVAHRPGEERQHDADAIREIVEHAVLADRLGIDAFTIGEHHREDMPLSSPDMVLAAIAARTERISLGTAVTVLSTDDPVRVHQRFATLDALSNGRAEPILGRGSFTESFGLFGHDLADYDELFEEKLDLWARLLPEQPVTFSGRHRPALHEASVHPHTQHERGLPTWVGVGGSPESVVRVARHGFNLMLAGLGMTTERLRDSVDLFHRALEAYGHARPAPRVGLSVGGHVADSDQQARDELWPQYEARMSRIGRQRGWAPIERASFEASIDHGMAFVGAPETLAPRVADAVEALGLDRFNFSYDVGSLPLAAKTRSIELLGTEVFPRAREILAERAARAA